MILQSFIRPFATNGHRMMTHKTISKIGQTSRFWLRPTVHKILVGGIPLFLYYRSAGYQCKQAAQYEVNAQNSQVVANRLKHETHTWAESIIDTLWHIVRFFQLCLIFTPPVALFPLAFFGKTEQFWLDMFVAAVERAGVVWIKAFQYLSHRRDVIGPKMAQKFTHLRQSAPQHSYKQTRKNFKINYGKQIQEIFQQFDQEPLASGSVSQVYKAKYKGKKVAVKVRHPGVDKHIKRDVNLLFFFSKLFSLISYSYEIPVSEQSMKRTLTEQIDFNIEKENLQIFNRMFEGRNQIRFPYPFADDTSESVLIESFVEGIPVTYYEKNQHPLNAVIARLGAKAFFEMLVKNNFIHADCHGGNIMVEIYDESYNFFSEIWGYIKEQYYWLQKVVISSTFESDLLRKLYIQGRQEEAKVRELLRKCKQKVRVNLIDVGMVISLDETDRNNFVNFLKSVIHSDGQGCSQMIYSLSNFEGKKIVKGKFEKYLADLRQLFSELDGADLDDLDGMKLFGGMLNLIRDYRMKLDGQFATLLTNMMVLEAIAKDIDPDINIMKCAIPYFHYIKDTQLTEAIVEQKTVQLL